MDQTITARDGTVLPDPCLPDLVDAVRLPDPALEALANALPQIIMDGHYQHDLGPAANVLVPKLVTTDVPSASRTFFTGERSVRELARYVSPRVAHSVLTSRPLDPEAAALVVPRAELTPEEVTDLVDRANGAPEILAALATHGFQATPDILTGPGRTLRRMFRVVLARTAPTEQRAQMALEALQAAPHPEMGGLGEVLVAECLSDWGLAEAIASHPGLAGLDDDTRTMVATLAAATGAPGADRLVDDAPPLTERQRAAIVASPCVAYELRDCLVGDEAWMADVAAVTSRVAAALAEGHVTHEVLVPYQEMLRQIRHLADEVPLDWGVMRLVERLTPHVGQTSVRDIAYQLTAFAAKLPAHHLARLRRQMGMEAPESRLTRAFLAARGIPKRQAETYANVVAYATERLGDSTNRWERFWMLLDRGGVDPYDAVDVVA